MLHFLNVSGFPKCLSISEHSKKLQTDSKIAPRSGTLSNGQKYCDILYYFIMANLNTAHQRTQRSLFDTAT